MDFMCPRCGSRNISCERDPETGQDIPLTHSCNDCGFDGTDRLTPEEQEEYERRHAAQAEKEADA